MKISNRTVYYYIKYVNGERSISGIKHDFPDNYYDEIDIVGEIKDLKNIYKKNAIYIRVKNKDELDYIKRYVKDGR